MIIIMIYNTQIENNNHQLFYRYDIIIIIICFRFETNVFFVVVLMRQKIENKNKTKQNEIDDEYFVLFFTLITN